MTGTPTTGTSGPGHTLAEIAALKRQLAEAQAKQNSYKLGEQMALVTAEALRARVETLEQIARDARPFCLGLGGGFTDGCAVADRIDAALTGKE